MKSRSTSDAATVAELGEDAVLARILPLLPTGRRTTLGPGDDAAVVDVDGPIVATVDTMLEGPDFRTDWSTAADLGWKAAATNLADVAAMGADPIGLLVALAVPPSTPIAWVEDFARGLAGGCAALAPDCGVVGGDLATAERITIAVTALGRAPARPVRRSGARVGDVVAVAGDLGFAGAGLAALAAGETARTTVVAAQLAPVPPIAAGPLAAERATAMLDLSDGIARDAPRIAAASGVGIVFDADRLDAEAARLAEVAGLDPAAALRFVLRGGEDHALLATFPADAVAAPFRVLGRVVAGTGVRIADVPLEAGGWDSIRAR